MKVTLQKQYNKEGMNFSASLTLGQAYEVLSIIVDSYQLLDDKHEPILYDMDCFAITDPALPDFWVTSTGGDGEHYTKPADWAQPGYFEDWHDHVPHVVEHFWQTLARLYPWTYARYIADRNG